MYSPGGTPLPSGRMNADQFLAHLQSRMAMASPRTPVRSSMSSSPRRPGWDHMSPTQGASWVDHRVAGLSQFLASMELAHQSSAIEGLGYLSPQDLCAASADQLSAVARELSFSESERLRFWDLVGAGSQGSWSALTTQPDHLCTLGEPAAACKPTSAQPAVRIAATPTSDTAVTDSQFQTESGRLDIVAVVRRSPEPDSDVAVRSKGRHNAGPGMVPRTAMHEAPHEAQGRAGTSPHQRSDYAGSNEPGSLARPPEPSSQPRRILDRVGSSSTRRESQLDRESQPDSPTRGPLTAALDRLRTPVQELLADPEAEKDGGTLSPAIRTRAEHQLDLTRVPLDAEAEQLEMEIRQRLIAEVTEEANQELVQRIAEIEGQWRARVRAEGDRCAEAMLKLGKVEEQAQLTAGAAAAQAREARDLAARLEVELQETQAALKTAHATPDQEALVKTNTANLEMAVLHRQSSHEALEQAERLLGALAPTGKKISNSRSVQGEDYDDGLVERLDDEANELRQELEETNAKVKHMRKTIVSLRWRHSLTHASSPSVATQPVSSRDSNGRYGPNSTVTTASPTASPTAADDEASASMDTDALAILESTIEALREEKEDLRVQLVKENREAMVRTDSDARTSCCACKSCQLRALLTVFLRVLALCSGLSTRWTSCAV